MTRVPRLESCLLVVVAAACSSGSKPSSSSSTSRTGSTPPSSAAPAASRSAKLTFTGGVGLEGSITEPSVRCNFPDLEGLSIAVLARLTDSTLQARVGLRSGKVKVFVDSGSGSDFHERAFEGTGVTSFDAATQAVVDSTLSETAAAPGSTKGSIGAITAIKGSVECGDQTPGTSTVTITGNAAEGALNAAALDPVRVECDAISGGTEVYASGLVTVGSTKALFAIGLTSDGAVTVDEVLPSGHHRYAAAASSKVTPTGAHVRAQVVEQEAASGAHTLDVEGDVSCGLHASG